MDLKVLQRNSDTTMDFTTGDSAIKVAGINKLVQQVVKIMLTTPGTDQWDLGVGGGIKSIVANISGSDDAQEAKAKIAVAVMGTERYLIDEQMGYNISNEEKLRSLSLDRVEFNEKDSSWVIRVKLLNMAGDMTLLTID